MRRRTPFHPSNRRLRDWLDSGEPGRITQHIETCDRCANQLEQLEDERISVSTGDSEEPETRSMLGQALDALFSPPEDLNERVLEGVHARELARNDVELFGELFTVGVEAAKLMAPPPKPPPSPSDEAADADDSQLPPPQEPS